MKTSRTAEPSIYLREVYQLKKKMLLKIVVLMKFIKNKMKYIKDHE